MLLGSMKFTSALDMFERLEATPVVISLVGLVKPVEGAANELHFSPRGCGPWVKVPGDMVEGYQPLGWTQCGDHGHHIVHLHLKRPGDVPGRVLADLLAQHQAVSGTAIARGSPMADFNDGDGPGCPEGSHWDMKLGRCV